MEKYIGNPILSAKDIPYPATLIFNAGVCKYKGKYMMLFRNDYGYGENGLGKFTGTNIGIAESDDGIHWTPHSKPWIAWHDEEIIRAYDPRLTVIGDEVVICFAVDTKHGLRGGIATTTDFVDWQIKSLSVPDNRNMVVFPEKINGKYCRLERPFPVYSRWCDRFDIWYSDSPDLEYWGNSRLVLGVEDVAYANDKIGPAAPPIKTEKGWLTTFHSVDKDTSRGKNGWEDKWQKRYKAGIMLLDLNEPWRVIGKCDDPILSPTEEYERNGFRNDVIFPGGMIAEDDGTVKIYYGAADTVVCLATAQLSELLDLCNPYHR